MILSLLYAIVPLLCIVYSKGYQSLQFHQKRVVDQVSELLGLTLPLNVEETQLRDELLRSLDQLPKDRRDKLLISLL